VVGASILWALTAAGGLSAAAWLAILADPARAWDLRPVTEDDPAPPAPAPWPPVAVVIPARNEAESLPRTLPPLLAQDYPGAWKVIVVDDRSEDGTTALAEELAGDDGRLRVLQGRPLPEGWVGKVWALEQGCAAAAAAPAPPRYLLLTDADIRHAPWSLRRLVAEAEAADLALNSRMARLRSTTGFERLLIPPFVFFFNLLYPMRRVNDSRSRRAAAAGGCELVRRDALERAGGLVSIKGELIDDVNLARRMKGGGERIRLATSRTDVVSVREYGSLPAVWRMVRRTAFDELRYSWLLLAATLAGLLVLFPFPPALLVTAVTLGAAGAVPAAWAVTLGLLGLAAWGLMAAAYSGALRFFDLPARWALTLPAAGVLYGGMTLDSARMHLLGSRGAW
jgi:hopene-associated glycosyltransferase HpnB